MLALSARPEEPRPPQLRRLRRASFLQTLDAVVSRGTMTRERMLSTMRTLLRRISRTRIHSNTHNRPERLTAASSGAFACSHGAEAALKANCRAETITAAPGDCFSVLLPFVRCPMLTNGTVLTGWNGVQDLEAAGQQFKRRPLSRGAGAGRRWLTLASYARGLKLYGESYDLGERINACQRPAIPKYFRRWRALLYREGDIERQRRRSLLCSTKDYRCR